MQFTKNSRSSETGFASPLAFPYHKITDCFKFSRKDMKKTKRLTAPSYKNNTTIFKKDGILKHFTR